MIGKLKDGFEVEVDEKAVDDWEYLKLLRRIDKGESSLIIDASEILLGGEEQVDRLAEHLKVEGRTSILSMIEALQEIMSSVNELKNS